MDSFLSWVGKMAGVLAILMVVPLFYVFGPTVMALFGMMPWETANQSWLQAERFAVPYIIVWIVLGVLFAIGRAADDRITKRERA